jgi:hypothetical protein
MSLALRNRYAHLLENPWAICINTTKVKKESKSRFIVGLFKSKRKSNEKEWAKRQKRQSDIVTPMSVFQKPLEVSKTLCMNGQDNERKKKVIPFMKWTIKVNLS